MKHRSASWVATLAVSAVLLLTSASALPAQLAKPSSEQGTSLVDLVRGADVIWPGTVAAVSTLPAELPDDCDIEFTFASVTPRGPGAEFPWKDLGPTQLVLPTFAVPYFLDIKAGSQMLVFLGKPDASGKRLPVGGASGVFVVRKGQSGETIVNGEANNGLWHNIEALHGGPPEPWWSLFLKTTRTLPGFAGKSDAEITDEIRKLKQPEFKLQLRHDLFLSAIHALSISPRG